MYRVAALLNFIVNYPAIVCYRYSKRLNSLMHAVRLTHTLTHIQTCKPKREMVCKPALPHPIKNTMCPHE